MDRPTIGDQKTRLSVNAHDDSAKMKTGKETLRRIQGRGGISLLSVIPFLKTYPSVFYGNSHF